MPRLCVCVQVCVRPVSVSHPSVCVRRCCPCVCVCVRMCVRPHALSVCVCFQVFSYTADKEIRTDDLCLDVSKLSGPVMMLKCHHLKGNQLWEYDPMVSK